MDFEQIKTFLAVASNGSFLEAAERMHITQSTVSVRIQKLEHYIGSKLFIRNRSGAVLTPAGRRFIRHAKSLILTLDQAKHDLGLPSEFSGSLSIGARIALWEGFLPEWIGIARDMLPDMSFRSEIGFEEDLMRRLKEGVLDIGLMYTPQQTPDLKVEWLFDETLVLVTTTPDASWPGNDYIYVDWGPEFFAQHNNNFPELERPAQIVNIGWLALQLIGTNGGSCFIPFRMVREKIARGELYRVPNSPTFNLPAYMVYPRDQKSVQRQKAIDSLKAFGQSERSKRVS